MKPEFIKWLDEKKVEPEFIKRIIENKKDDEFIKWMTENDKGFKQFDRVVLINDDRYKKHGLEKGMHGTILDEPGYGSQLVWFDGELYQEGETHYGTTKIDEFILGKDLEPEDPRYKRPASDFIIKKKINGKLYLPDEVLDDN